MNAPDLARLELAKRAFQATLPRAPEVQTAVRRARLALRRPKPRRSWFGKGLVLVVLAIGSLAYAKPQALGELAERVLSQANAAGAGLRELARSEGTTGRKASAQTTTAATPLATGARAKALTPTTAPDVTREPSASTTAAADATDTAASEAKISAKAPDAAASSGQGRASGKRAQPQPPTARAASGSAAPLRSAPARRAVVSGWGVVSQALANGDEARALTALNGLASSSDPATRDKAAIGKAQLLLASGARERACGIARDLMGRGSAPGIDAQARALLQSCSSPSKP